MLNKLIFVILTATLLTFAGATTITADLGNGCDNVSGICDGSGDQDRDRDRDRDGDGDGDGNAYGYGNGNGAMDGSCSSAIALTPEEEVSLLFMRELEKLAHDSYLELGALWEMAIFDNIAVAEQKHMDAIKNLLDCHKLTDPATGEIGTFTNLDLQAWFDALMLAGQESVMDALYAGAEIEETDIKITLDAPEFADHPEIVSTYATLMCASRNHLRAFVRQIEINGGTYDPAVLDEEVFWEIALSDMERDCGKNNKG